jgi:hypothetical protein
MINIQVINHTQWNKATVIEMVVIFVHNLFMFTSMFTIYDGLHEMAVWGLHEFKFRFDLGAAVFKST